MQNISCTLWVTPSLCLRFVCNFGYLVGRSVGVPQPHVSPQDFSSAADFFNSLMEGAEGEGRGQTSGNLQQMVALLLLPPALTFSLFLLPPSPAPISCSYLILLLLSPAPIYCSYLLLLSPAPISCSYLLLLSPAPISCSYHLLLPPASNL